MESVVFWDLGLVSDQQLRAGLATLLANGYRTEARIIAHIAEVEERKIHAKDGSPSLFDYCVRQLGLSESEAFHRLTTARIARRFPVVFAMIDRRKIHLTAACRRCQKFRVRGGIRSRRQPSWKIDHKLIESTVPEAGHHGPLFFSVS